MAHYRNVAQRPILKHGLGHLAAKHPFLRCVRPTQILLDAKLHSRRLFDVGADNEDRRIRAPEKLNHSITRAEQQKPKSGTT
jgi:hypothetical protein